MVSDDAFEEAVKRQRTDGGLFGETVRDRILKEAMMIVYRRTFPTSGRSDLVTAMKDSIELLGRLSASKNSVPGWNDHIGKELIHLFSLYARYITTFPLPSDIDELQGRLDYLLGLADSEVEIEIYRAAFEHHTGAKFCPDCRYAKDGREGCPRCGGTP